MTTVVGVSRPIKEISTTNKQGSTNNIQMNVTLTLSRTDDCCFCSLSPLLVFPA